MGCSGRRRGRTGHLTHRRAAGDTTGGRSDRKSAERLLQKSDDAKGWDEDRHTRLPRLHAPTQCPEGPVLQATTGAVRLGAVAPVTLAREGAGHTRLWMSLTRGSLGNSYYQTPLLSQGHGSLPLRTRGSCVSGMFHTTPWATTGPVCPHFCNKDAGAGRALGASKAGDGGLGWGKGGWWGRGGAEGQRPRKSCSLEVGSSFLGAFLRLPCRGPPSEEHLSTPCTEGSATCPST